MAQYQLMDENGNLYYSSESGLLGGYRRLKIYGDWIVKVQTELLQRAVMSSTVYFSSQFCNAQLLSDVPQLLMAKLS